MGDTSFSTMILNEYLNRKHLAEIGYMTDTSKLSSFKAECFLLIAGTFATEQKKKHDADMAKSKRRKR